MSFYLTLVFFVSILEWNYVNRALLSEELDCTEWCDIEPRSLLRAVSGLGLSCLQSA